MGIGQQRLYDPGNGPGAGVKSRGAMYLVDDCVGISDTIVVAFSSKAACIMVSPGSRFQ